MIVEIVLKNEPSLELEGYEYKIKKFIPFNKRFK